jgi:hypothetical protein
MQFTRGPIEDGQKAVLVKRAFQIEAGIVNHFANRWWQSVPHFGPVKAQNNADSL